MATYKEKTVNSIVCNRTLFFACGLPILAAQSMAQDCTSWDLQLEGTPSARNNHAMAFDSVRGKTVLVGGYHLGTYYRETWEYDGTNWALRSSLGPSDRSSHAMCFDSLRGVTALFGGGNSSGLRGDTYEWNGTLWTLRSNTGPSARANHTLSFDSGRGVSVLFGGGTPSAPWGDTWEWDGTSWADVSGAGTSPARTFHASAYDPARARTVLFGGSAASGYLGDTWEWDGSDWVQVSTTGPAPRGNHILTFDSVRNKIIMFGGYDGTSEFQDTWEWDGASWNQVSASGPLARNGHAASFDSARGVGVLFGGLSFAQVADQADTWEYPDCDADEDGVVDADDNCPSLANAGQEDVDADDVGDACDNCELPNPSQADCQLNGLGDACEIAHCTADPQCADCNLNGVPDGCEPDCNNNLVADECDLAGSSEDCDGNLIPDECDIASGRIALAANFENSLPAGWTTTGIFQVTDQCRREPVCDGNQWVYAGDLATCRYGDQQNGRLTTPPILLDEGVSTLRYCSIHHTELEFDFAQVFVNHDLVFEESGTQSTWQPRTIDLSAYSGQTVTLTFHFFSDAGVSGTLGWQIDNIIVTTGLADCNDNSTPDICDIAAELESDCNQNNKPDSCEPDFDCNENEMQDICDIAGGVAEDCDSDLVPDSCVGDLDADSIMDVCDNCPIALNPSQSDLDADGIGDDCDECDTRDSFAWVIASNDGPGNGRFKHAMVFDAARGVTVMFGGLENFEYRGDTWTWDGIAWTQVATAGPSPRAEADMVYDSARQRVVLFGGCSDFCPNDTWEWDGTSWQEINTLTAPEPRTEHAMAYDSRRGVTVLVGGQSSSGMLADTWEWDGQSWRRRTRFVGPSSIRAHAMAFDPRRNVTVLHGGEYPFGPTVALAEDTWEWDGIDWVLRSDATPGNDPRADHAMTYDTERAAVILWGGSFGADPTDVYEWRGTKWIPYSATNWSNYGSDHRLAYDSLRRTTVKFGGLSLGLQTEQTQELSSCGVVPLPEAPAPDPSGLYKTRFISFVAPESPAETALRVRLNSLHHVSPPYPVGPSTPFTSFEGQVRWVGPPAQYVESASTGTPFYASVVQCTPNYQDWSTVGLLHVTGSAVVPSSVYEVENVSVSCMGTESSCTAVSAPLTVVTTRWGDVEIPYNPPSPTAQPDVGDISALVNKFRSAPGAPIKARALLTGTDAFGNINIAPDVGFGHIASCVDAFRGQGYPFKPGKCANSAAACVADSDCGASGPCNLHCP